MESLAPEIYYVIVIVVLVFGIYHIGYRYGLTDAIGKTFPIRDHLEDETMVFLLAMYENNKEIFVVLSGEFSEHKPVIYNLGRHVGTNVDLKKHLDKHGLGWYTFTSTGTEDWELTGPGRIIWFDKI